MTISTTNTVAGPFDGNDVATEFPFTDIKVFNNSDLVVTLTDTAGAEVTLTEDVDYTLALNSDQDASPGGTITYPVAGDPLATDEKLTGKRISTKTQGMDLSNQSKYDPAVVETSADKAIQLIQELQEEVDRSVKVSISSEIDPDSLIASIETSESNAAASAVAAAAAETNAETAETNAAAEVVNAQAEVTYAEEWAIKPEDTLVSAAAGGNEVDDYSALHHSAKALAAVPILTKTIDIGDWNMDTSNFVQIAHGLDVTKIRPPLSVMIRNDTDNGYYDFMSDDQAGSGDHRITADAINVNIVRSLEGLFDNNGYISTSYNRGWITINYID
jgi:hypothetical protein